MPSCSECGNQGRLLSMTQTLHFTIKLARSQATCALESSLCGYQYYFKTFAPHNGH